MGATSTLASDRRTSRRSLSACATEVTTSASRSTATAIACSPSTALARSSTATSCSRSPRCTRATAGVVARTLRDGGAPRGAGAAVTVMPNYGFHSAMERAGVAVATTSVGDRYVLEELRARDCVLGGEQSGHIIAMGFNTPGV